MKKIGIILAALVIIVILFSACAAQHKCDAYSSVHRDKVEKAPY
jgi:outer membrane murein-binding lipoprotein Lpp